MPQSSYRRGRDEWMRLMEAYEACAWKITRCAATKVRMGLLANYYATNTTGGDGEGASAQNHPAVTLSSWSYAAR